MTASTTPRRCRRGIIIIALAMSPLLAGGCHDYNSSALLGAGIGALAGYAIGSEVDEYHHDGHRYDRDRHHYGRHRDGYRDRRRH